MLRVTALMIVVAFLAAYAWRDWFKALCAVIVMMAIVEHPDVPKEMFSISGLNPWNILLLSVSLSWLAHRRVENLSFDLPRGTAFLAVCYVGVFLIAFVRAFNDPAGIIELHYVRGNEPPGMRTILIDELINPIKWAVPSLLLFTGARTRERQMWAMAALLSVCVLLSLQIIRWMPLGLLVDGAALSDRALRVFDREIGYHRVDLAALTAGGFWAIVNLRGAVQSPFWRLVLLGSAVVVLLGLALTGGRTGYGTWAALGLFFAVMRSKKYLIAVPVIAMLMVLLVPAARDRMMYGFDSSTAEETAERFEMEHLAFAGIDLHAVTSGRAIAWPFVIEKIREAPWFGHGKLAMQRTGVALEVLETYEQDFPHPHNAYLEVVFDNGLIGALPILLFFAVVVAGAFRCLQDRERRFESAIGAVALSFIGAQLIASVGSQSFYPTAGTVVMWCAIAVQLRLVVERAASVRQPQNAEPENVPRRPGTGRRTATASR